jgi:hypothetical protein
MIKLINLLKKINEAKQVGTLYHWTKLKNLKNIIETNTLNTSHAGHGIFNYVSTTRSKDKFQFGIAESSDVAIVLDGDKISNRYKIIPYHDIETEEYDDITYRDKYNNQIGISADDWEGEGIPKMKKYGAFDEMEELIVGSLYPLNKYIIKIILYKTDPEIESLLKEKNIPYEIWKDVSEELIREKAKETFNISWENFINDKNVDIGELKAELRLNSNSLKDLYIKTLNKLNKLEFPLKIYRALAINDINQINYNNLGNHWTFNKESAEPYFGDYSKNIIVLEGKITLQDIDIVTTIAYNMLIPHENEIYVTNPHNVKQIKILNRVKKSEKEN